MKSFSKICYSEYEKDALVKELKRKGHQILSIEKDFSGVFTVFYLL